MNMISNERLKEIDGLYIEKCEEVNELKEEIRRLKSTIHLQKSKRICVVKDGKRKVLLMTKEQSAINRLKCGNTAHSCKADYIQLAIEALEKQIPKKPNSEGDGFWDGHLVYDTWICPCCEKHYEVDYDDYDYCPNCGQKLDWSGGRK